MNPSDDWRLLASISGHASVSSFNSSGLVETLPSLSKTNLFVKEYDLTASLISGQAFRWQSDEFGWQGVVGSRWVRLRQYENSIVAEAVAPVLDWRWLTDYLQIGVDLPSVLATFPCDDPMHAAMSACRGLRLLRQDPWECLASFICSSTKQIVQIRQIVALLCERMGEPLKVPAGTAPAFEFPSAARIAAAGEAELRACKMGFRAGYLLRTAQAIASGAFSLESLTSLSASEARERMMELPGVGRKIADCVLLFAFGFPQVFPVDVWVQRALGRLYFPGRSVTSRRLQEFADSHFGPNAGYAQQYLFHYMRVHSGRGNR